MEFNGITTYNKCPWCNNTTCINLVIKGNTYNPCHINIKTGEWVKPEDYMKISGYLEGKTILTGESR